MENGINFTTGDMSMNQIMALLRIVDRVFMEIARDWHLPKGRRNHELDKSGFTSMIRWKGPDGMDRNVVGRVDPETSQIHITCNAWMGDKSRTYEQPNVLQQGKMVTGTIKSAAQLAFTTAMRWREEDLTSGHVPENMERDAPNVKRIRRDRERDDDAKIESILDRLVLDD